MPENIQPLLRESQAKDFEAKFGVDPTMAAMAFKDAPIFHKILGHMYLEGMEELRECDLDKDGARIQGQVQVLWTLMNIPNEILAMKE